MPESGEYLAAVRSFELAAAADPSNRRSLARIEHKLGSLRQRQGERDLAGARFRSALNLFEEFADLGEQARVLTNWSLTAHHQGETAQAHNLLGILARNRDDLLGASRHLEQSLSLVESLGDVGARIAALNNLALVYGADGNTERAVVLLEQVLALCVSIGDRHREAALRNNLADVLHAAGRSGKAMSHLKQAVFIFAEIGVEAGAWQPEIWKLTEW